MGDFNSVLNMDDRIGGNPVSLAEIVEFPSCVEACELIELPQHGSKFTWNDKQGENRIYSKIDWVFVNQEWLDQMPDYSANFLTEGISGHCPVKIALINTPRKRRQFKYCNVWATYPKFMNIVKEEWQNPVEGCSMFQIVKKLKSLKRKLRQLKWPTLQKHHHRSR